MTQPTSRRRFLGMIGAGLAWPAVTRRESHGFRVRTITAGVALRHGDDLARVDEAVRFLAQAKQECGYSGLMLPVLEDPVLARRAGEGRYGVSELLLYSSVCGTGLDVVPLPGDTSVALLAATIGDVAALATRYQKPLSARLFPAPGKRAGEKVRFDDPHLTEAVVMALG